MEMRKNKSGSAGDVPWENCRIATQFPNVFPQADDRSVFVTSW
jgi:hypothetical protein